MAINDIEIEQTTCATRELNTTNGELHCNISRDELRLASSLPVDHPVILFGPSGSGKTYTAERIHQERARREGSSGRFIRIQCGALTEQPSMARSELFGHSKGAFSGANESTFGLLGDLCDGSTIFLDEVERLGVVNGNLLLDLLDTNPDVSLRRLGDPAARKRPRFHLIVSTKVPLRSTSLAEDLINRLLARSITIKMAELSDEAIRDQAATIAQAARWAINADALALLNVKVTPTYRALEGTVATAIAMQSTMGARNRVTKECMRRVLDMQMMHAAPVEDRHEAVEKKRKERPSLEERTRVWLAQKSVSACARCWEVTRVTARKWLKEVWALESRSLKDACSSARLTQTS
jgi:DNA-binding NtrC family response regulator